MIAFDAIEWQGRVPFRGDHQNEADGHRGRIDPAGALWQWTTPILSAVFLAITFGLLIGEHLGEHAAAADVGAGATGHDLERRVAGAPALARRARPLRGIALASGALLIVRLGDRYELLPRVAGEQVRQSVLAAVAVRDCSTGLQPSRRRRGATRWFETNKAG